jgi:hypothetical protein
MCIDDSIFAYENDSALPYLHAIVAFWSECSVIPNN